MSDQLQSPHDKFIRSMMKNPRVVREFFEANLPDSIKEAVDFDSIQPEKDSFINDRLRLQVADILFKAKFNGEEGYFYTLLEHQSNSQKLMPFRLLKYMIAIQDYHMETHKTKTLPFVFPIVLYTGKKSYRHSMDLFDLFGPTKGLAREVWSKPYKLLDLSKMPEEELRPYLLYGTMCRIAKHIRDPDIIPFLYQIIEEGLQEIDRLGEKGYIEIVISYIYGTADIKDYEGFKDAVLHIESIKEEEIMSLAQRMKEEGRQEGLEQGLERGLEQGLEQGIGQGLEIVALNMLKKNKPLSEILEDTGLSFENLKKLKDKIH